MLGRYAAGFGRIHNPLRHLGANRFPKAHMAHQPFAKKCRNAAHCAIKKLIGNHEVQGLMFLFQGTNCTERKYMFHPQLFHAINIGAKIEFRRGQAMPFAMPRKKRNIATSQLPHHIGIRWRTKGSFNGDLFLHCKTGHTVEAAASDDSNNWRQKSISPLSIPTAPRPWNEDVQIHICGRQHHAAAHSKSAHLAILIAPPRSINPAHAGQYGASLRLYLR